MKIWYSLLAKSKESLHWPEIKNEHPHEPASSGALVIKQLNYIENGGKRQMGKYYVDWNDIRPEEAGILIDAVARYASVNEYPEIRDVLAILGIKKKIVEE